MPSQPSIKVSQNIYNDIEKLRKQLIKGGELHQNLSIRETMDIAWNMKKMYDFTINESIGYVQKNKVDISYKNHGRKLKKPKRGKLVVDISGERVYPNILYNKKGSVFDVLFLLLVVVVLGFGGFFITNVWNDLYQPTKSGNIYNNTGNAGQIGEGISGMMGVWDYVVPTVMFMGTVIIAILVFTNPIPTAFLVFGVVFVPILMYFAIQLKIAYVDMLLNSASLTSISSSFPITDLILRNLAMYFLFLYIIIIVVQYGKSRSVAYG